MPLSRLVFAAAWMLGITLESYAQAPIRNIVLVHGAFADGSGWMPVYETLKSKGYSVSIVQEPETSLADDVAATERVINNQDGPVILVGHSWGGQIITEAGMNPKVRALVYVAGLAPAEGESVNKLESATPPDRNHVKATGEGFLILDPEHFAADFAPDIDQRRATYMANAQVVIASAALDTPVQHAAWRHKPSFGIVPLADHIINPKLELWMYKRAGAEVTTVPESSHAVYLSHPDVVARVIEDAAKRR